MPFSGTRPSRGDPCEEVRICSNNEGAMRLCRATDVNPLQEVRRKNTCLASNRSIAQLFRNGEAQIK